MSECFYLAHHSEGLLSLQQVVKHDHHHLKIMALLCVKKTTQIAKEFIFSCFLRIRHGHCHLES